MATTTSDSVRVSCSEQDFLEQDDTIRSQNYVCLSFLSPEEVIKRKELFYFEKFQASLSSDLNKLFADLKTRYPNDLDGINFVMDRNRHFFEPSQLSDSFVQFTDSNTGLETQFYEENNFQTSMRGIKVRGVYDTIHEAQNRCETLKRKDPRHNIYIAQVGCWCPWSPNPDDIQNQEFAETTLNTLMKKYQENQITKDIFFEDRKNELKVAAMKKPSITVEDVSEKVTEEDPWMRSKTTTTEPTATNEVTEPTTETTNKVSNEVADN
jgi:hypothetical protein